MASLTYPKISFVMPTRNRGDRIGASIKSILGQTLHNIELIIVDNNSEKDDKTQEVIEAFDDERIRYYKTSSQSISEARNFGNMMANANIVAVSDSDDLSYPERAENIVKSYENETWDVFFSSHKTYDESKKEFIPAKYSLQSFEPEMLRDRNYIVHSSSAYTREIAMNFPYNSFFKMAEDYDFFSRLASEKKKFFFCPKPLVCYVVHDGNISGAKGFPVYDQLIKFNRGWTKIDQKIVLEEILRK